MASPATRQRAPVETKVAVGSFTGIIAGLLTWGLVAYVPAFRTGLPAPVAALIPVAVAWLAHTAAAYLAPHTPRPGMVTNVPSYSLPGVNAPPMTGPGNVTITGAAPTSSSTATFPPPAGTPPAGNL